VPASVLQNVLDRIFVAQRPSLIARLVKMVRCRATAEELAQEAYVRVSQAMRGGEVEHVQPFLYRTAHNLALDHLRAHRVRGIIEDAKASESAVLDVAALTPTPETFALDAERLEALECALAELPLRARQIVLLSRVHGLSHEQIARRLNVSKSTVEKDTRLALAQCVASLKRAGLF